MRTLLILCILVVCHHGATATAPMQVTKQGERLVIAATHNGVSYEYTFERCMANALYTFHKVTVNGVLVNHATSDNIGPILVKDGGWTGGNHTLGDGGRSASTIDIECLADGKPLIEDNTYNCSRVDIAVVNCLQDPRSSSSALCDETVVYTIVGNTIEVRISLNFKRNCVVERYYGMQSMMKDEKAIYTPAGMYDEFTPIEKVDRFTHGDYPRFTCFVEQGSSCYQACYLSPQELGDRAHVAGDDYTFIGNSYGKSYHKLMGNTTVNAGEHYTWHGAYVWFTGIITHGSNNAFTGFWNGLPATFECSDRGCTPQVKTIKKITK